MATLLICWLPSVLAVGIFCLWLVCSKVREKLKIPIENKFAIFFLFLFFAGFWSVNFFPETVWYLKFFVVLSSLVFFLINYKIPGFLFAGIGAFLNALVMAGNGLKMPILAQYAQNFKGYYVAIGKNTFLPQLADTIKVEDWMGFIILSPGDIIIYIGIFIAFCYLWIVAFLELLRKSPN